MRPCAISLLMFAAPATTSRAFISRTRPAQRVGGLVHVQKRVQALLALHAGLLVDAVALEESANQLFELRN